MQVVWGYLFFLVKISLRSNGVEWIGGSSFKNQASESQIVVRQLKEESVRHFQLKISAEEFNGIKETKDYSGCNR